jgi:hypothetical protein
MTSFESIDLDQLDAISGGLRPGHIAGQALNGFILGGTGGAVSGFAAGAFAGSILPGLGTVAGAATGAAIGGINGAAIGAIYGGYHEYQRQRAGG